VEWDGSSGGWEVQGGVDRCLCFWTACWLPEGAISSFAPSLATRARGRSVHEALQGDNGYVTSQELSQLRCSVIMSFFGKRLEQVALHSPRQPTSSSGVGPTRVYTPRRLPIGPSLKARRSCLGQRNYGAHRLHQRLSFLLAREVWSRVLAPLELQHLLVLEK
jgi:hypothetical protein